MSCAPGEVKDGLGPADPSPITQLDVAPDSAATAPGGTVTYSASATHEDGSTSVAAVNWSATGGTIDAGGTYTAGTAEGDFSVTATLPGASLSKSRPVKIRSPIVSLSVSPSPATLTAGSSITFSATATRQNGNTLVPQVTWTATGGSIDASGVYTAGATPGIYTVTASLVGGSLTKSATITVTSPVSPIVSLSVSPNPASVSTGGTQSFSASATRQDGSTLVPSVTWSATGGTISAGGLYTAGATAGTFTVTASLVGGSLTSSVAVTVSAVVSPIVGLVVSPPSATVNAGATQAFTVSATRQDGSTLVPSVTWSATGGSINGSGVYTAGNTGGTYRAIAVLQGGTLADTSVVTVVSPTVSLTLTPATATVNTGGVQSFVVSAGRQDGSTYVPAVTWSATGGTVTTGGVYTAGSTAGAFRVIAVLQGGTLADTSTVTVVSPTVSVTVSPGTATVNSGATQAFSASATRQNGTTYVPTVTWSATGGTITSGGVYTAGATSGTYRVIGVLQGGTLADTSAVTIPAAVLQAVILTPASVTLNTGASQQFSVTGQWSNGATTAPAVTYSGTGGAISAGGLYTAGGTAGTFRVIAVQQGGTLADTAAVTLTAPSGGANECASPGAGWIWCDDFEQNRLSSYFEYDNSGGQFARAAGVGHGGSYGMRAGFTTGQVDAGALHLAFGRTPQSYFQPVDAGTANYREIYWRVYLRTQAGWATAPDSKLSRITIFASPTTWAQAMIGHLWSGSAGDQNYLILDPASGTDAAGNLLTTKYNDWANMRWLGIVRGNTPIFDASHVGAWYCVEAHVKLNTAGAADGIMEYWVNDVLDARAQNLNWVGSFSAYGLNAIFLENYVNPGSPAAQERYLDRFVVSTSRIGC